MKTTTFKVTHVEFVSSQPFADVVARFERQLGQFDHGVFQTLISQNADPEAMRSAFQRMEGSSGMMLFGKLDHGGLLSIIGARKQAVQFVVGNPLIALEMTRHDLGAGLYAPLRVLIFEDAQGQTRLEYDLPSSLFGRLNSDEISAVGRLLDAKMETLARMAIE